MKCPFELPVRKIIKRPYANPYIENKGDKEICMCQDEAEVDYIVQAINSHEKLANALNTYGNHLTKCKYRQGLKGQTIEACDCGFEQALKEAEKQ